MTKTCPNPACSNHTSPPKHWYWKDGYYKCRYQPVPRYRCKACGRRFSSHTFRDTYDQHRPELNADVKRLRDLGFTIEQIANILECNRKTVMRKLKAGESVEKAAS